MAGLLCGDADQQDVLLVSGFVRPLDIVIPKEILLICFAYLRVKIYIKFDVLNKANVLKNGDIKSGEDLQYERARHMIAVNRQSLRNVLRERFAFEETSIVDDEYVLRFVEGGFLENELGEVVQCLWNVTALDNAAVDVFGERVLCARGYHLLLRTLWQCQMIKKSKRYGWR